MNRKFYVSFFAVTSIYCGGAIAADPVTFDIAGIKLGMSAEEVAGPLKNFCESQGVRWQGMDRPSMDNPYGGEKYISITGCSSIRPNGGSIIVRFNAISSGKAGVSSIAYRVRYTPENIKALHEAAIKKFGKPDYIDPVTKEPEWCASPKKIPGKDSVCWKQTRLHFSSENMVLSNPLLPEMEEIAVKKQNTVKPAF